MKTLSMLVFCLPALFSNTTKNTENTADPRDPYIGTWTGKYTTKEEGKSLDYSEDVTYKITKQENTTDKIIITKIKKNSEALETKPYIATVNGNTFILDKVTYAESLDTNGTKVTIEIITTGSGALTAKV